MVHSLTLSSIGFTYAISPSGQTSDGGVPQQTFLPVKKSCLQRKSIGQEFIILGEHSTTFFVLMSLNVVSPGKHAEEEQKLVHWSADAKLLRFPLQPL